MIEFISGFLGFGIVFVLFTFGLLSQIKDRNMDIVIKRMRSKRMEFAHKLAILSFYGFLFFHSIQYLIQLGLINNEVILHGESPQFFIYLAFAGILFGKYFVHSAKIHFVKVLF